MIKHLVMMYAALLLLTACGGGSDNQITVIISPVELPIEIEGAPTDEITEGSAYSFTPTIVTPAVGSLLFNITNKPSWASFNTSNGTLSGTPSNSDIGLYDDITITATDDLGQSSIGPFSITVISLITSPAIEVSGIPDPSVYEGSEYSFTPTIITPAVGTAVFTIDNQPIWSEFDTATGALTGTPVNSHVGEYAAIIITATDAIGSSSIGPFTINVNSVVIAPEVVISGTPDSSVDEESTYSFTPTISTPAVGSLIFGITNQPSWASFNTATGALTGMPDDADVGVFSNITITATDDIGNSSIGPFSITVNAVNDAPELADQTKSGLAFSSAVAFSLTASDVDSATSSYVYSVQSQATYGSVVITDHATSAFEYQPSSVTGIDGDSFTVQLSDGTDTSAIATITLSFSDGTAPNITLTPNDGASNVIVNSTFIISSDDPIDTTTLSYNSSAGACTGTVQISDDSFTNCVGITSAVASNLNRTITLTGAADLDASTTYEFKVTTGVENLLADAVASDVTNSFTTVAAASSIVISGTPAASVDEEATYSFTPTIDTPANGTAVFSIANEPSWASFNTATGALTGMPDDADVGVFSNITITATDDIGNSSIGPFSITVNAVNDAPELADQTKSGLAFSSAVAFSLTASDVDSATSSYVYSVQSQATYGSVVITDHATSAFEYQPSSVTGIDGDSFTVQLSDGTDTSAIATITLSFSDGTAPNITLTPNDGASNVIVNSTFIISSDDPIDTTTLSYNSSAGACTGTVQISDDSFTNCVGITSAVASNLNRTITLTGAADLDASTTYEFKVTTGVENLLADAVASDVTNSFTTSSNGLMITEVGESGAVHDTRWFELYNASSSVIDLSTYSFKSRSVSITGLTGDSSGFSYSYYTPSNATFTLPSVDIQPGQYVVVRAKHFVTTYASNERVVYVYNTDAEDGTYPYWDTDGYIDLIKSGVTEDFVTFGASYSPTTSAQWSGTFADALPSVSGQYGHSIARDGSNSDSDVSTDWTSMDFATKGGANDVTCTTDADADGIPDCSEVSGSTFAGLPLYDWGARTGQKDIFIEVDYMDATNGGAQSADEGITPRQEALQKVVDAFSAQGIAVHFDVGDLYDAASGVDPADFDLGGGEEVPFVDAMTFSTSPSVYDYKLDYMEYERKQIFHYLIFVNTQNGSQGSSGLAELEGNDLIVSLGEWDLNSSDTSNENTLINYQASTLMHELGHNLGLTHGGDDANNYEPNYLSVMNYLYQLYGLPTIASDEGDRFYLSSNYYNGHANCYAGLSNAPNTSTFVMDFSHGNGIALNLASLNETLGLGQSSTDGVDFNCDGDKVDTGVSMGSGTWTDHDDWSNLILDFQRYSSGDNNGVSLMRSFNNESEDELMTDKVGNDRTPVAEEFSPPPEFFERLRQSMAN